MKYFKTDKDFTQAVLLSVIKGAILGKLIQATVNSRPLTSFNKKIF